MAVPTFDAMIGGAGTALGGVGVILWQLAPWLGGAILIGGILVYSYFARQYNKDVMILKISGTGFRKINDKAKLVKDKAGVSFWKLKKVKLLVDIPPSECMLPGDKGEFALGYMNSIGEIIWAQPGYTPFQILKKIKDIDEYKKNQQKLKENGKLNEAEALPRPLGLDEFEKDVEPFLKSYKPVSTSQRASYAYQKDQAERELKLDWVKANFPIIIGGIFVVIMLVVLGMMWGKFMDPLNQRASQSDQATKDFETIRLQQIQLLHDIYSDVQVLKSNQNIVNDSRTKVAAPPSIVG